MVALTTYMLALAVSIASVQAAPAPYTAGPSLFTHDPYSIHRRSIPNVFKRDTLDLDEVESSASDARIEIQEDEMAGEGSADASKSEACSRECAPVQIPGVKNDREALCSDLGLESTRACAECIDTTWPNARFQQSAMSEYEKILVTCGVRGI